MRKLEKEALDACRALFADTTVSKSDTKDSLALLVEELEIMIDAIKYDLEREGI